ncbi:MAG: hypothetical protein CMF62_01420 [Magnetococcales bacterium]|nr:hypothetical protein [Magnetococcales bacterium]|tara:strand:+ start:9191 stop:10183 length:993 start_codon:yes stop_codon:yes gene_type:complete
MKNKQLTNTQINEIIINVNGDISSLLTGIVQLGLINGRIFNKLIKKKSHINEFYKYYKFDYKEKETILKLLSYIGSKRTYNFKLDFKKYFIDENNYVSELTSIGNHTLKPTFINNNDLIKNYNMIQVSDYINLLKELWLKFKNVNLYKKFKNINIKKSKSNFFTKHFDKTKKYINNDDNGLRPNEMIFYSSYRTSFNNLSKNEYYKKMSKVIQNDILNLIEVYYNQVKNLNQDDYIISNHIPLYKKKYKNKKSETKIYYELELNLLFFEWYTYSIKKDSTINNQTLVKKIKIYDNYQINFDNFAKSEYQYKSIKNKDPLTRKNLEEIHNY